MRWIKRNGGKIERGEAAPPTGDLFFVDEAGSAAVVGGVMYIDGQPAALGKHRVTLQDEDLDFDTDKNGKIKTKQRIPKGGR